MNARLDPASVLASAWVSEPYRTATARERAPHASVELHIVATNGVWAIMRRIELSSGAYKAL